MNITKEYYDYVSSMNQNIPKYNFKYEKYSPMHKCTRLLMKIKEVENNIIQLSSMSKKSSSFNNSHLKISTATMNIKKLLMEIESELDELKTNELINNKNMNKFSKVLMENSIDVLNSYISELTLKFQKLLQQQAEKIKNIEKRKTNISSNKKKNINIFNEYVTDITNNNNNNYNEEDVLLEVKNKQITQYKETQYYKNRLDDVQMIEKTMGEISGLVKRLGQMTYNQSFIVEGIRRNTDIALEHVEKGEKEVKQILENAKSNKWLFIKIFFILLCMTIFYIIFIA